MNSYCVLLLGPNVEEENMWAVTLSGTKREYEWAPEDPSDSVNADDSVDEESDPSFKPNHRLLSMWLNLVYQQTPVEKIVLGFWKKNFSRPRVFLF